MKLFCGFFSSRPKFWKKQVSNCLDAVIDDFVDENVYDIDESTTKIPKTTTGQQWSKDLRILFQMLEIWKRHV